MINEVLSFNINHNNDIPKYQQIVNVINNGISKNLLTIGDILPSVNSVGKECRISKNTVFKAYSILKKSGFNEGGSNKGYYLSGETKKVLLILNTFKAYKKVLYHSFTNNLL